MIYLLDTHILLWAAGEPHRLSESARTLLADPHNTLAFSAASMWEVSVKSALGREEFQVSSAVLRRGLLEAGYRELDISSAHAVAAGELPLPLIHLLSARDCSPP